MKLEIGSVIADYEILELLGKGGMGAVYRVRNTISNRIEALKVLNSELMGQTEMIDRFLAEIRVIASFDHPNITKLHTAFRIDAEVFMLMEFVEGTTLSKRLQHGPIPLGQSVDYSVQILSALAYAHEREVVHRDIKPANIIIDPGGTAKIMDFGIAKSSMMPALTQPGTTLGSIHYMSPEQAKGLAVDARSDLYSMGVLLYEVTTGQRPFRGDSVFSIMDKHLRCPPTPPCELNPLIPDALNDAVLRALAKDPAERFQTAALFAAALWDCGCSVDSGLAEGEGGTFFPGGSVPAMEPPPPTAKPRARFARLLWLTIGSTAGIVAFCVSAFWLSSSVKSHDRTFGRLGYGWQAKADARRE